MSRFLPGLSVGMLCAALIYLFFWPVPIDPVAWSPPPNPGYTGRFAPNERLAGLDVLPIGPHRGPESVAIDSRGRIYVPTENGTIVRLDPSGKNPTDWAHTGGRPLGMAFAPDGALIVADAFRGLLAVTPDGTVRVLATEAEGIPIAYADDLDVASDGRIFFSDASTRFGAAAAGHTLAASLLDLLEHGGHGRLLVHDPANGETRTLVDGLQFANGVALAHDERSVLVNETGLYRVVRFWLEGNRKGELESVIEALPGFPDNLTTGRDGRYWVALVSPRNPLLDRLGNSPRLRAMVQRLPGVLRPGPVAYGHVIAIDDAGRIRANLQDPSGSYPMITHVAETSDMLFFGSLVATGIGRLPLALAGLRQAQENAGD